MFLKGADLEEVVSKLEVLYSLVEELDQSLPDGDEILAIRHRNVFPYLRHDASFYPYIDFPADVYAKDLFNLEMNIRKYLSTKKAIDLARLHDAIADNIGILEDMVDSRQSRNTYTYLLQDLLTGMRIIYDKNIVQSSEIRSKVHPLVETDTDIFLTGSQDYERMEEYVKEAISIERELGGLFRAVRDARYWAINFLPPDSRRLWNAHISSYSDFLNTNSNGFWHVHHSRDLQTQFTNDGKKRVAFSPKDFGYFEGTQLPMIVGVIDAQGEFTMQIMVKSGVYTVGKLMQ